jgi:hypothetical protein
MNRIFKHKLVTGATALAVVAFAGGAYAATQDSPGAERQAFINDVAKHLGVSPQALTDAFKSASLDRLQTAVKDGELTQAQADQLKQEIQQGKGIGPTGPGFGMHRGFGFAGGVAPDAAAKYLGLTDTQLSDQLGSGKTLAQIATSRGKSVSGLKSAMLAAQKSKLDQAVANKDLTSAEEQQIISRASTRLDNLINGKLPPLPKMGTRRFFFPHPGFFGSADGGSSVPAPPAPPPVGY